MHVSVRFLETHFERTFFSECFRGALCGEGLPVACEERIVCGGVFGSNRPFVSSFSNDEKEKG